MKFKLFVFILITIAIIELYQFFFVDSPRLRKRMTEVSDPKEREYVKGRMKLMSIHLFWAVVATICLIVLLIYRWDAW
jgi:ABC-type branched-subunit amino acid transport system permease subunit